MKVKLIMGVLLCSYLASSYAFQVIAVHDNSAVHVKISETELNHIVVANDRIKRVKGIEGQYQFKEDEDTGHLFLKSLAHDKIITLFVTTEQGNTYQMQLTPYPIPAETIVLQPIQTENDSNPSANLTSVSEETVLNLVESMVHSESPADYAIQPAPHQKSVLHQDIRLTLVTRYLGSTLIGEIFVIKNVSPNRYTFSTNDFSHQGVRAIAFSQTLLLPGQTAYLYRVVSHD